MLLTYLKEEKFEEALLWIIDEDNRRSEIVKNQGIEAFFYACEKGLFDIVSALVDRLLPAQLMQKNMAGLTALHAALINHQPEIVQHLISNIPSKYLEETDNEGNTILHLACLYGYYEIAHQLINDKKVNLYRKNQDGNTPLHLSCSSGFLRIARSIVNADPTFKAYDLFQQNNDGNTSLHLACLEKQSEIAALLINPHFTFSLALRNRAQQTALEIALRNRKKKIASNLINVLPPNELAQQETRSEDKLSLLAISCLIDEPSLTLKLIEKLPADSVRLQLNINRNYIFFLQVICSNKQEVAFELLNTFFELELDHQQDKYGNTALHSLCRAHPQWLPDHSEARLSKKKNFLLLLIEQLLPEQLIQQNDTGDTALHLLCKAREVNIASRLALRIVEFFPHHLGIQNANGQTALHITCKDKEQLLSTLLMNHFLPAHLGMQDNEGNTALHIVISNDFTPLVHPLITKMSSTSLALQNAQKNTALHLININSLEKDKLALHLIKRLSPIQLTLENKNHKMAALSVLEVPMTNPALIVYTALNKLSLINTSLAFNSNNLISYKIAQIFSANCTWRGRQERSLVLDDINEEIIKSLMQTLLMDSFSDFIETIEKYPPHFFHQATTVYALLRQEIHPIIRNRQAYLHIANIDYLKYFIYQNPIDPPVVNPDVITLLPEDIIQDEIYPFIPLTHIASLDQPINTIFSIAVEYWHLLQEALFTLANYSRSMPSSISVITELQMILTDFISILEKEIFPDYPQKIYAFRNALLFGKSVLPLHTQQLVNPEDGNKLFDSMMSFFDKVDSIALPTNHEERVLEVSASI